MPNNAQDADGFYRTFCCGVEIEDPSPSHPTLDWESCPSCGERNGYYRVDLEHERSAGSQYCPVADLPDDSPTRLRVYQFLVAWSLNGGSYIDRKRILDALALDDSKQKTVSRAISDAKTAGWVVSKGNGIKRGPLPDSIVSPRTSEGDSGGE